MNTIPRPLTFLTFCLVLTSACQLVPKRVAVMDFENASNEHRLDYLSTAIPESLITVMDNFPEVVYMLERQDINHYLKEIDRSSTEFDRFTRYQQLGKRLAADYMVVGSVTKYNTFFVVHARLFSVEKGQIIPGTAIARRCDREEQILEIVEIIGRQMVQQVSARSV